MSEISTITLGGVTYDIKDAVARSDIGSLDTLKASKTEVEAVDQRVDLAEENIQSLGSAKANQSELDSVKGEVISLRAAVGTPLTALTDEDMESADHEKVYVFAGTTTETYSNGHWYFWNTGLATPAWDDGGTYNAQGLPEPDATLTASGVAADAKETGKRIKNLSDDFYDVSDVTVGVNKLDYSAIKTGHAMTVDGAVSINALYCYTDYIPVEEGNVLLGRYGSSGTRLPLRYVAAFDQNKEVLPAKGLSYEANSFTIQAGVEFVIITFATTAYEAGNVIICTDGVLHNYVPYSREVSIKGLSEIEEEAADITAELADLEKATTVTNTKTVTENVTNTWSYTEGEYINANGVNGVSSAYKYSEKIPVSAGDIIHDTSNMKWVAAYNNGVIQPSLGAGTIKTYTVPEGVTEVIVTLEISLTNNVTFTHNVDVFEKMYEERCTSSNHLNPDEIVENSYINTAGVIGNDSTYARSGYIPVLWGDEIRLITSTDTRNQMRFVAAFDSNKNVIADSGAENIAKYVVKENTAYIVVSAAKTIMTAATARININGVFSYASFTSEPLSKGALNLLQNDANLRKYPLTIFPEYVKNTLSYKPLGQLQKPYICLTCDDGYAELATYTIPMLISKDVPCSFGLFDNSPVLADETYTETVIDAVENHGCEVSMHGDTEWTDYDEYGLAKFFDEQEAFFATKGLVAKGAICPSHYISKMVSAVAGGRYGVVRSGYEGHGEGVKNFYNYYTSWSRSNVYGLSSTNTIDHDLSWHQNAIEYIIANHGLIVYYWHDWDLTSTQKTVLEGLIDYAKSRQSATGLTFCKLSEIPNMR